MTAIPWSRGLHTVLHAKGLRGLPGVGEVREQGPEPIAPHSSLDLHPPNRMKASKGQYQ